MLPLFSAIAILTTIGLLIGGSVCMFVNHDTSQECYVSFAIGLSFLVCITMTSIFFSIVHCVDSSGPILPSGKLSSLPSSPSKTLVSRRTP